MPHKTKEARRIYQQEYRARKKAGVSVTALPEALPEASVEVSAAVDDAVSNVAQQDVQMEVTEVDDEASTRCDDDGEEETSDDDSDDTQCEQPPQKLPFYQYLLITTGVPLIIGLLGSFGNHFGDIIGYLKKTRTRNP